MTTTLSTDILLPHASAHLTEGFSLVFIWTFDLHESRSWARTHAPYFVFLSVVNGSLVL